MLITSFFRDPDFYKILTSQVFPSIVNDLQDVEPIRGAQHRNDEAVLGGDGDADVEGALEHELTPLVVHDGVPVFVISKPLADIAASGIG